VIEKPHFDLFPCSQEEKPCGAAGDVDSVTDQAHLRKLVSVTKNIFVFHSKTTLEFVNSHLPPILEPVQIALRKNVLSWAPAPRSNI
jgi:hypothetical protein